jgi:hypothetical protein
LFHFINTLFDNTREKSISNHFRRKRFDILKRVIDNLPKPVKILDVGGTQNYWEQMGILKSSQLLITILNIEEIEIKYPNFTFVKGDARDLKNFNDKEFDIVFSNSVIEHLADLDNQRKMADEIKRVGKSYIVQTPNYYFPIEPHFLIPLFQFYPEFLKIFLLTHFEIGWFEKQDSKEKARFILKNINLLKKREIQKLFPASTVMKEKIFFLTKSFIIVNLS